MKNSRILLSALTACVLSTSAFAYQAKISGGKVGTEGFPNYKDFYSGTINDNYTQNNAKVTIESGNTYNNYIHIYGGYSVENKVERNTLTMSGGNVNVLYGGYANRNDAYNNSVTISGGSASNIYGGFAYFIANNNSVTMSGGSADSLNGGYSMERIANNNIVIMSGGNVGNLYGGFSGEGEANNNKITISDGTINGDAHGGFSNNGDANNNTIVYSGGIINGDLYGGYSRRKSANNNTIIYNGGIIKGDIYGGYGKTSANNKLIISGTNLNARSVKEDTFQSYLFSLPTNIKANDTMLKLTKPLTFNDSDKLEMNAQGSLNELKLYDTITLVNKVGNSLQGKYYTLASYKSGVATYYYGFLYGISTNQELQITLINNGDLEQPMINTNNPTLNGADDEWENWGLSLEEILEFLLALDGIEDVGNAIEVVVSEESKSLSEGVSAAMATLNSAGDTIAGKATENAMANAGNSSLGGTNSIGSFGAIGAGANRYKTGSYVDSKSVNLVVGVALGKELNYGKLVVGPFIEFGYSDYETHNDFSSGHVKGDGDSKYYGIGALTRFDLNDFKGSRPYLEFSARFGRNKNDFSNDIGADYDVSSNYYGLHAGLGYIIKSGANSFDIYGKYFFTHLNSADTTLKTGENFAFDAVKSHKTRLGIKYSREIELANGSKIAPYIGAGWEKEYSSDAKATTTPAGSSIGLAVSAPSLKGNSAMAEIGINIGKEKGFKADIGLMGYAGIHRGVNANLILQYEF